MRHTDGFSIILSVKPKPPPDTKKMPKAERKSKGDEEEDVPIHGATNEKEAKQYSSDLDTITV